MNRERIAPLVPMAIVVDQLKIGRRSNTLKVRGVDLDSGRRMTLELCVEGEAEAYANTETKGPLVLVISIERLSLV